MRNPRSPVVPKPSPKPSREPQAGELDEFVALGEWLRKLALGLTAALVTARAYFPSEPDLKAEGGPGLVWALAILIVTGLALVSALVGGTLRVRWSWTDAAVIVLMALVGVSASVALDRRTAINLAWQWAAVGFAYLLLRNLPRTRGESMALAGALVATAVAVSVYGLYQVGVELGEVRAAYNKNPEAILRRLNIAPDSPARKLFEDRVLGSSEVWSTFALANSLAGFLVGPLVLALAVAWRNLTSREGKGGRALVLTLAAFPALAMLVCLLLTKSRSASIGLAVALVVLACRAWGRVRARTLAFTAAAAIAVVALLIGVGLATGRLDTLVFTQSNRSLRFRMEYWVGTWRVITQLPGVFWRGVGPGNFGWAYVRYKLPQASEEIVDPHNMPLEVWATAGIGALAALLAALGLGLWNLLGPSSKLGERGASAPCPVREERQGADAPRSPADEPWSRSAWLVASAGGGWLLVSLLGELNPFEGDLFARWLILGAAWLGAVLLGQPLWRRLPMEASALGLGALAVMINLMAAGGIGIPTVALGLWSLIALGLNLREDRPCSRLRTLGGRGPAFVVALVWASLCGVFVGAVLPFWRSEREIARAEAFLAKPRPDYARARDAYVRAADPDQGGDRLSARPYLGLAFMEYQAWRESGGLPQNKMWRAVPIALLKATSPPRNPNSWSLHRDRAVITRDLLRQIGNGLGPAEITRFRANVVEAARKATLLYPTNANLHALLAEASADISFFPDAVSEAEEALRLDRLTPHPDKKLPSSVREHLEDQLPAWRKGSEGMKTAR